ncbi:uncharacterized protein [Eurosta solidaginis]|uniref:uncharacterized protein n=1 Tax=Eurosta solidaginis TaxID=178769 RepID=UPI003530656C
MFSRHIPKVQMDDTYRQKVAEKAAGSDFYEEIIFSESQETEMSPTQDDDDFVRHQRTPDSDMVDENSEMLYHAAGCSSETPMKKVVWLDAPTKFLISKVEELQPKVGKTAKIKSKRHMWTQISHELKKTGYPFTWVQVEAKFFALERRYKKVQYNNSKTGRNRQICPYQNELDDILQQRVGINPKFLLDSETNKRKSSDEHDESSQSNSESLDSTPSCSRKRGKTTIDILFEKIDSESEKQQKWDEELKQIMEENIKQK